MCIDCNVETMNESILVYFIVFFLCLFLGFSTCLRIHKQNHLNETVAVAAAAMVVTVTD